MIYSSKEDGLNINEQELTALYYGGSLADHLSSVIHKPLSDLISRPGKKIRARLVEAGWTMAHSFNAKPLEDDSRLEKLKEAIEYLHAGSLVIDDIQDGSRTRRGQPCLHIKYGLPISLVVGNYLYFWPLEIIRSLNLTPEKELFLYRFYHRTLIRAHWGQALDVGIPIDTLPQDQVHDACLSAMELKSGALFSLGLVMGAAVGNVPIDFIPVLDAFGHGFGMGLQMFDDVGNLESTVEPSKRREDLMLRRPTWVWACAAKYFSKESYVRFVSGVHQLPHDPLPIETWFDQHDFLNKARRLGRQHMELCYGKLEKEIQERCTDLTSYVKLRDIGAEIMKAYE
jgi:geranylgeranyl pyrophosphate synthase